MNLVDSSGWLEYFTDGKNSKYFSPAIEDKKTLIISALNIYEVYRKVLHERGEEAARQIAAVMLQTSVIPLTENISLQAAHLSVLHKLPMADSMIYATALSQNATVWTQDKHFEKLENVKYFKSH